MTKKNLKFLFLFFLISVFIFPITGCSSDSDSEADLSSTKSYNVNFTVTDQNEQAVEAAVTLAGETKTANSDGVVSFSKVNGRYDFEVSAENYDKYSDSIVVDGSDFAVDVKLIALNTSDSEPGDSDNDNSDSNPDDSEPGDTEENDISPPRLVKLFGWLNEQFHGLDNLSINSLEDLDKDLDQSFDYLIVYFSEKVKTESELVQGEDFEVNFSNVDSNEKIVIDEALLNPEFLILKIDQRFKRDSYKGLIRLEVTNTGREKITDIAGNMLAEDPDTLVLEVK